MTLIEQLMDEKEFLLKRIEAIDVLLRSYDAANYDKTTNETFEFPINGRTDKKVLWIFKYSFKRGVKLNDVQDKFNLLNGTDALKEIRIDNVVRTLKKNGKLVVVKYNNSNKLSFWALSSWVNDNDFKDEFRPNEELLPVNINDIEIVRN